MNKETLQVPQFTDKADLIDFLVKNKSLLIAQKKAECKFTDGMPYRPLFVNDKGELLQIKADAAPGAPIIDMNGIDAIKIEPVINTTCVMDSHDDVHINGLWNKTIKEGGAQYLCREHNMSWMNEGIISDEVKALTKTISWKELGFEFDGDTQALVFKAKVYKGESPIMFAKYCTGKVKQHSVRMAYVKLFLCVNDNRYEEEKANWDKYFPMVVNQDLAESKGYFWAVTEAKIMYEGSAVPAGSNRYTPNTSIAEAKNISEPVTTTTENKEEKTEPLQNTQPVSKLINPNFF